MGKHTKIEYSDSMVNIAPFCPGCELFHKDPAKNHCYAATLVNRYKGLKGWPKDFNRPAYFLERVEKALSWSDLTGTDRSDKPWLNGYPRIIFVNALGDGFSHIADPDIWLTPFIEKMRQSPHIWLILTKWPHIMREYFDGYEPGVPHNFWLGTTVTGSRTVWRLDPLLRIRGRFVRWASFEPLLNYPTGWDDYLSCAFYGGKPYRVHTGEVVKPARIRHTLNWIATGGESGVNARPSHPGWFFQIQEKSSEYIKDHWEDLAVVFHKQNGVWVPYNYLRQDGYRFGSQDFGTLTFTGQFYPGEIPAFDFGACDVRYYRSTADALMVRVGKKDGGRQVFGVVAYRMPAPLEREG